MSNPEQVTLRLLHIWEVHGVATAGGATYKFNDFVFQRHEPFTSVDDSSRHASTHSVRCPFCSAPIEITLDFVPALPVARADYPALKRIFLGDAVAWSVNTGAALFILLFIVSALVVRQHAEGLGVLWRALLIALASIPLTLVGAALRHGFNRLNYSKMPKLIILPPDPMIRRILVSRFPNSKPCFVGGSVKFNRQSDWAHLVQIGQSKWFTLNEFSGASLPPWVLSDYELIYP